MPELRVRRPGLLTTVQDLGRPGWGRFGVSPSGAMDTLALRVANRLVGNAEGAPALEVTAVGPEMECRGEVVLAIAGANLSPTLDGDPIEAWRAYRAGDGAVLRFGARRQGARCVVAVAGGIAAPSVFGSAATDLEAGLGGLDGRRLRGGDVLDVADVPGRAELRVAHPALLRAYADPFVLRVLPGEFGIEAGGLAAFYSSRWRVSQRSNRMGFRLDGPALPYGGGEMLSEPIPAGTIQLPPAGLPILLMADRPTVGGYPRLAAVITADQPKAAQLWVGDEVRFSAISLAQARDALGALEAAIDTAVPR
jgi:biotin-dependent carboxylase-like uncharacterized protein